MENKYEFIPLFKEEEILKRIKEVANQISLDYKGQNLHCICE